MVSISMYRGNLHRVSDVPRRWLMPKQNLSVKDFRSLLIRRKQALSRLRPSNPNPNPKPSTSISHNHDPDHKLELVKIGQSAEPNDANSSKLIEPKLVEVKVEEIEVVKGGNTSCSIAEERSNGVDCAGKPEEVEIKKDGEHEAGGASKMEILEKTSDEAKTNGEPDKQLVPPNKNENEKRKREVEEKLQVLNTKKHNLVQVLKQLLNAEEELKRRSNTQQGSLAARPFVQLQVEIPNGSEANAGGHVEGETEDVSNHNLHSRHLTRMSSASPSSESPMRRSAILQHNAVPHPSRASPRVGSTGHQAQPGHPPMASVSASGTNYIASTPSPAASGGTSVFRDSRLPSPWN